MLLQVETGKTLDINPNAYRLDVLIRIITREDTDPIDDPLPYSCGDAPRKLRSNQVAA
ncbi:hypothetical protein [Sphingobium sp.]|uniref:hypothetical protein n=1 Tax=Sphingobium sp. TaxID=1912891 RepID=UPI002BF119EF|nr:hypothetical protein [Sphingobium sp.]HUD93764.1 hypothetical protein [Sphingobium sp.]